MPHWEGVEADDTGRGDSARHSFPSSKDLHTTVNLKSLKEKCLRIRSCYAMLGKGLA
ncbi:hypothetical protein O9993_16610 [Vibrio lentus]|nr:hypothetical protein [Vibrio lentus]